MNLLVTGAAGFIGSHVCECLIKKGNHVIGIDNFDDFYARKIKKFNITNLVQSGNFHFYETDIRDATALHTIFASNKINAVIHLAAKAGVRPSIECIAEYYDVNINGTVVLLESMRANEVKKMLFASSSSCMEIIQRSHFLKWTALIILFRLMLQQKKAVNFYATFLVIFMILILRVCASLRFMAQGKGPILQFINSQN